MPPPEEKLESNQRWLRRLARRLARSSAQADDLVQETYLTALSKPAPDGPMKPWLHGVMRRLALREFRGGRRRARREESFHLGGPSVVEPDPLLDYGIDRARLRTLVESLPEPFRSTVEQRFLEGLSCVEIAQAAGVPAGTIRWRQSRALELLRSEIERPARHRARRRLAWLPLVGLEPLVAAGRRAVSFSRSRSGLLLAGVALVMALVALVSREVPAGRATTAEAERGRVPVHARGAIDEHAVDPDPANDSTLASSSSAAVDGEIESRRVAQRGARSRSSRMTPVGSGGGDPRPRDLYDCTDEGGELHCVQREATVEQVGGPVCVILDRSLDALERARARMPALGPGQEAAFLRAARLANLFLASELGCGLAHEAEREKKRARGDSDEAAPAPEVPVPREPTCQTEEDESGRSCTTCTDENGAATTVCAPVECESSTGSDGEPCTTCTDADGAVESDCQEEPDGCQPLTREVDAFANEIMPILNGDIDLNQSEGSIGGCTRGPCHGTPRPGGLHLDLSDTIENNLARFSCFVDLANPELSQIFLCPSGDARCVTFPHPGVAIFTPPDDLNYERILAYLRANAP